MSTVLVACKLGHGLILRLHEKCKERDPMPGGYREIEAFRPTGEEVRLNGSAVPYNTLPDNPPIHGYALTEVDSDFWQRWCQQNKDADVLKNGIVFAHEKPQDIRVHAKENRDDGVTTGLEPLDPDNLPKGLSMRNLKITTADEMPKIRKRSNRIKRGEED